MTNHKEGHHHLPQLPITPDVTQTPDIVLSITMYNTTTLTYLISLYLKKKIPVYSNMLKPKLRVLQILTLGIFMISK